MTSQPEVEPLRLSMAVSQVVFTPTILAYGFVAVDWPILGLCVYAFFMAVALYRLHLFERFGSWPIIARVAVLVGPPLIGSGFIWGVKALGYWLALPVFSYCALTIVAGLILRATKMTVPSRNDSA
jgi:hypothetical protein